MCLNHWRWVTFPKGTPAPQPLTGTQPVLTFKPVRKQGDGRNDEASNAAALTFDPANDLARQEFAKDADINHIMKKFGVIPGQQRQLTYQTVDYDLDMQGALHAVSDAKLAYNRLDADVRAKYPTWLSFYQAVENGTFETPKDQAERERKEALAQEQAADAEFRRRMARREEEDSRDLEESRSRAP